MSDATGECAYARDVSAWNERVSEWFDEPYHGDSDGPVFDDRLLDDEGRWQCHRRTRPGDDYCVFHAHESDEGVDHAAPPGRILLDIVNGNTDDRPWNRDEPDGLWEVPPDFERDEYKRRETQFVGASLGTLRLSYERLDGPDAYPIDLRLATVERLDLSNARVDHPLWLDGLEQTDDADGSDEWGLTFESTNFVSALGLTGASVAGGISVRFVESLAVILDHAEIEGDVAGYRVSGEDIQMRGVTVDDGDVSMKESTVDDSIRLQSGDVDGDVSLDRSEVGFQIRLGNATVEGEVSGEDAAADSVEAKEATVDGGVSLDRSEIGYQIRLDDAEIRDGALSFDDASVDRSVVAIGTSVAQDVLFKRAAIGNNVNLGDTNVGGAVSGDYATVTGSVRATDAEIGGTISLADAQVDGSIRLWDAQVDGSVWLSNTDVGTVVTTAKTRWDDIDESGATVDTRIDGSLTVSNAAVGDWIAVAPGTTVGGRLAVEGTTTRKLWIGCALTHPAINAVSLGGSTVTGLSRLDARADESPDGVVYDFERATVGDIDPKAPDDNGDTRTFEHLRCLETAFDGFAFGRKRDELRDIDWAMHEPRVRGYRDIAVAAQRIALGDGYTRSAFDTARDLAALLTVGVAMDLLEDPDAADDEAESLGDLCRIPGRGDGEYRFRSVAYDGDPHPDLLRAYRDGSGNIVSNLRIVDEPADSRQGDPVSWAFDWVRLDVADWSGESHAAVLDRVREIRASIRESVDTRRVERAAVDTERATDRCDHHRERLRTAIAERSPGGGSPVGFRRRGSELVTVGAEGPDDGFVVHVGTHGDDPVERLPLPDAFDLSDDEALTAAHVEAAVARTLATRPRVTRSIAAVETSGDGAVARGDSGVPASIRELCEAWEIPVDSALAAALRGTSAAVVDLAEAIEADHEALAEADADLVVDDPPEAVAADGTHPYAAVADAVLHREAVEAAESLAERLVSGRIGPAVDDLGVDMVALETAVARDIADPERAVATDSEAESTYAEAKNGASDAGDETAAGNFFRREAQYARRQHWQRWRDDRGPVSGLARLAASGLATVVGALFLAAGVLDLPNPLAGALGVSSVPAASTAVGVVCVALGLSLVREDFGALFDWFGNLFLWLTMGYGERPQRVLGLSGVIVAAFALVYWATGADIGTLAAYGPVGYVILSLQLFATLLVGTVGFDDPWLQFAAGFEGFLGVFVIGMFVVTVTRAVHR